MNALGKLAALFVGGDEPVPVEGAGCLAPAPEQAPGEREAAAEAARCKAVADDLDGRLAAATTAVAELTEARSAAARDLVAGDAPAEIAFAEATSRLDAAVARRDALEQLLAEATAASQAAYATLRAVSAPRLAEERRQLLAEATAKAQAASERFCTLYAETSAALAALADELDGLAALDTNAAHGVGYELGVVSGDPLLRLTRNGWTVRPWSAHVGLRYTLVGLVPPKGA